MLNEYYDVMIVTEKDEPTHEELEIQEVLDQMQLSYVRQHVSNIIHGDSTIISAVITTSENSGIQTYLAAVYQEALIVYCAEACRIAKLNGAHEVVSSGVLREVLNTLMEHISNYTYSSLALLYLQKNPQLNPLQKWENMSGREFVIDMIDLCDLHAKQATVPKPEAKTMVVKVLPNGDIIDINLAVIGNVSNLDEWYTDIFTKKPTNETYFKEDYSNGIAVTINSAEHANGVSKQKIIDAYDYVKPVGYSEVDNDIIDYFKTKLEKDLTKEGYEDIDSREDLVIAFSSDYLKSRGVPEYVEGRKSIVTEWTALQLRKGEPRRFYIDKDFQVFYDEFEKPSELLNQDLIIGGSIADPLNVLGRNDVECDMLKSYSFSGYFDKHNNHTLPEALLYARLVQKGYAIPTGYTYESFIKYVRGLETLPVTPKNISFDFVKKYNVLYDFGVAFRYNSKARAAKEGKAFLDISFATNTKKWSAWYMQEYSRFDHDIANEIFDAVPNSKFEGWKDISCAQVFAMNEEGSYVTLCVPFKTILEMRSTLRDIIEDLI